MERCWILLGMMGSGKTTVGRALAELSGREFVDTDQILQRKLGRPIMQLFELYGEDAFRAHETKVLRDLQPGPYVLSTGGGIIMREENWTELRRLGKTIYLDSPLAEILQRLEQSKKRRPLLQVEEWQERVRTLLDQRLPLYRRADFVFDMRGLDIDAAAETLHRVLVEELQ
jgi:shikimate kinase